ncbi:CGNR zinc finger domain-containing protein [Streptomyces sp. NPDC045251]|uniref:CGNR zinc finger domain-containing protein n=1 Tax=unclassified Streptomyces TaxID=2593676 RepID=UPI0033FCC899
MAVARVRACEAEDCVLLFLPQHPRRRWCSAGRPGRPPFHRPRSPPAPSWAAVAPGAWGTTTICTSSS